MDWAGLRSVRSRGLKRYALLWIAPARQRRLHLSRLEEAVNNRGVNPFAVAQVVVSIWRHASFQRPRHDYGVTSDLDLGATVG
jgi:hypothetical protein